MTGSSGPVVPARKPARLSRPRAGHPPLALRARGLGLLLQQQVQTSQAREPRGSCEKFRIYEAPACLSAGELACAHLCKAQGLMRGAGGQVGISLVNGAKEMLRSAAVRNSVLGATRGSLLVWWSALGPRAKVGRCLLSSSRSRARHCCSQIENSKPLTSTKNPPIRIISTTTHAVSKPLAPCFHAAIWDEALGALVEMPSSSQEPEEAFCGTYGAILALNDPPPRLGQSKGNVSFGPSKKHPCKWFDRDPTSRTPASRFP